MDRLNGSVDVSGKDVTLRRAVAESVLAAPAEIILAIRDDKLPKRDAQATARAAALLAAKATPSLIPHCHPISITSIRIEFKFAESSVTTVCEVTARDRTGPDMEALTGASAASLTLYDLVKSICPGAQILRTRLIEKEGGKGGHWKAGDADA
jgi:cyclic pyranopterin phosphate synthase